MSSLEEVCAVCVCVCVLFFGGKLNQNFQVRISHTNLLQDGLKSPISFENKHIQVLDIPGFSVALEMFPILLYSNANFPHLIFIVREPYIASLQF